jgi:hypothetical protein
MNDAAGAGAVSAFPISFSLSSGILSIEHRLSAVLLSLQL